YELRQLKIQRTVANDVIRRISDIALQNIREEKKKLQGEKSDDERKQTLARLQRAEFDLEERLQKRWYFGAGVKLEELVDFRLWLQEADRLGINLLADDVLEMVHKEVFFLIDRIQRRHAFFAVHMPNITEQTIINALRDEFRARIAQLAIMSAQIEAQSRGPDDIKWKYTAALNYRIAPTPAESWDFYLNNVAPISVAIVPVDVNGFTQSIPTPNEV